MANKKSKRGSSGNAARLGSEAVSAQPKEQRKVLFAVGDADCGYSENKIWTLGERLAAQSGCRVVALSHSKEALEGARKVKLPTEWVAIDPKPVTVMDRLRATDAMIRETADVLIPGSRLPLWKVLAMDDFLASLQLFGAQPAGALSGDALVVPLMGIDNNTRDTCGLYTWAVAEAKRRQIPIVGVEVSPIGNKHTLSQLPVDHFAVKSRWSREFLIREGLAQQDQVSVLKWEESYCLWPGRDDYTDAYLQNEAKVREMLGVDAKEFVVMIPHHVAFLWEVRKILQALAALTFPVTVVIRVDRRTVRRHFTEREIVQETYPKELAALPRVVIDDRVGVGLLLQLADLVIAPFAGTTTEHAALCQTPTIICQSLAQEGWRGEFTYWEPHPENLVGLITGWQRQGLLHRTALSQIVLSLLKRQQRVAA